MPLLDSSSSTPWSTTMHRRRSHGMSLRAPLPISLHSLTLLHPSPPHTGNAPRCKPPHLRGERSSSNHRCILAPNRCILAPKPTSPRKLSPASCLLRRIRIREELLQHHEKAHPRRRGLLRCDALQLSTSSGSSTSQQERRRSAQTSARSE